MHKYPHFIPENAAPYGAKRIIVLNDSGVEVARFPLGSLALPNLGDKLYSFGALSDVHVASGSLSKFQKGLNYLNNTEKVAFTCIAGDLTGDGDAADYSYYQSAVAPYSNVYEITGNHDVQTSNPAPFLTKESTQPYTGHDMYYSFTHGDDVFIMFGMSGWISKTGDTFTTESLQWLYETLEANRNKRCFVFEHCPSIAHKYLSDTKITIVVENNGNGEPYNNSTSGALLGVRIPTGELINRDASGLTFRKLMAHYKNVIWFHGHSHMDFHYQADCSQINYDKNFGCHSIHIPSLASGRKLKADGSGWENPAGSYGYVVDVYDSHIVLRGRDFLNDEFMPIASFCLDTTPQEMAASTFAAITT